MKKPLRYAGLAVAVLSAAAAQAQTGNVGVGTINPRFLLHAEGSNATPLPLGLTSASDVGTWLKLENNSTGGRAWHLISTGANNGEGAGKLIFRYGPSGVGASVTGQVVSFTTTGVGINTAVPDAAAELEVAGQVKITGGSPGLGKVLTSDANGLASWQTPATASTTVYSVSSVAAPTAAATLTPATTVVSYSDNSTGVGNGVVTLGAGTAGQLLILTNLDAQPLLVQSTTGIMHTLLTGYGAQFVYVDGAWRRIS